jgi:hypothetical protein
MIFANPVTKLEVDHSLALYQKICCQTLFRVIHCVLDMRYFKCLELLEFCSCLLIFINCRVVELDLVQETRAVHLSALLLVDTDLTTNNLPLLKVALENVEMLFFPEFISD